MGKITNFIVFLALSLLLTASVFAASHKEDKAMDSAEPVSEASAEEPSEEAMAVEKPSKQSTEKHVNVPIGLSDKCNDLESTEERVKCRLQTKDTAQLLRQMPEECRDLKGPEKSKCVAGYQANVKCQTLKSDVARVGCAKTAQQLKDVKSEKEACMKKEGANKKTCAKNLKDKVSNVVKFRIRNLQQKAQDWQGKGKVTEENALAFVSSLEQKVVEFEQAQSPADKKEVVKSVQKLWIDFVHSKVSKEQMQEKAEEPKAEAETMEKESESEPAEETK